MLIILEKLKLQGNIYYIHKNLKIIKDFTIYCETLNMTYEEIINYNFKKVKKIKPSKTGRKPRYNKYEWLEYKKEVRELTYENIKDIKTDKLLLSGKNDLRSPIHYVYDHKISVYSGFKNNIPCDLMASLCNLRLITALENSTKGMRNHIDDENRHIFEMYLF